MEEPPGVRSGRSNLEARGTAEIPAGGPAELYDGQRTFEGEHGSRGSG